MQLNKQMLADLPAAQPTNPALKLPPLKGMGTSFVSQAQDKDWDMPRRRRAMGAVQRKLNYQNQLRAWKKSGGLFGLYRGPRPQAPAAPLPEFAPYVKGVLTWGLAKREKGSPLSEAEVAQRREAAKARWAGVGAAASVGAGLLATGTAFLALRRGKAGKIVQAAHAASKAPVQPAFRRSDIKPGEMLVFRGGGPDSFDGVSDMGGVYTSRMRRVANSYGKFELADEKKPRKNGQVKAFAIKRADLLDLTDPNQERQFAHWALRRHAHRWKEGKHPDTFRPREQRDWQDKIARQELAASLKTLRGNVIFGKPYPTGEDKRSKIFGQALAEGDEEMRQFLAARGKRGIHDPGKVVMMENGKPGWIRIPQTYVMDKEALRPLRDVRLKKLFDESKIKRDEDGKFAPKGDAAPRSRLTGLAPRERSVASIYSRGPQWEPGEGKTYDWSRSVRPTKDMPFATRQAYATYRSELDRNPPAPTERPAAAEIEAAAPQLPTAGGTRFKMMVQRPQVPSGMSQDQYIELARWAAQRTRDERDEHIKRSIGRKDPGGHKHKMLLPADANPKDPDIRFAFNVARNIAMHNVGLFHYDYQMTPETLQAMQPYKAFIKHTARKLGDVLRSERPGAWAQFRREFGQEFKDGRTYKFDTAGQVAGEKKKFFLRHEPAVKAALNSGLAKAFGNPGLTQAEIEQRRNAARARWARVAGRADARDNAALKLREDMARTEFNYRGFEPPAPGWRLNEPRASFDPAELEAVKGRLNDLFRQYRAAEQEQQAKTRQPSAKEIAKYNAAMKEYAAKHAEWRADKDQMLRAKVEEFDAANNTRFKLKGKVTRDGRIRGTSGLSAEAGKITKETNKAMAGSEPVPPKSPFPSYSQTPQMREIDANIKALRGMEQELSGQRSKFELQRERGFRWSPTEDSPKHSGWDTVRARNVRRDDLRMYEKEPQYREAERAHIARVKAVKEDRRKATIQRLFRAPAAPNEQPKVSPAPPPIADRVAPKVRLSGKASAVAAGVLGGAALGYGLSRWRRDDRLGKALPLAQPGRRGVLGGALGLGLLRWRRPAAPAAPKKSWGNNSAQRGVRNGPPTRRGLLGGAFGLGSGLNKAVGAIVPRLGSKTTLSFTPGFSPTKAWGSYAKQMHRSGVPGRRAPAAPAPKSTSKSHWRRNWRAGAASAGLLAGAGAAAFMLDGNKRPKREPV
jgi:hypothetical protein